MKNRLITKIAAGAAVLALGGSLAACSNSGGPKDDEAGDIRIGVAMALTPPGDVQGSKTAIDAMQLAVDEINEAGGVLGRNLMIDTQDTQGTPSVATTATRKLIQDGASVIIGEWTSGVTLQVGEIAHSAGVPQIVTVSADDDITGRNFPEVFRISPYNTAYSTFIARYVQAQGFKVVGLSIESSAYGQGVAKAIEERLEGTGITVKVEEHASGATDLTPQLISLRNAGADVVIHAAGSVPNTYLIMKQAREVGLAPDTPIVASWDYPTLPDYWQTSGDAGVGITYVSFDHPELGAVTSGGEKFAAAFRAKYGYEPSYWSYLAYDAIHVFANAAEKAGSVEHAAVIDALGATDYEGSLGRITFEHDAGTPEFNQWVGHKAAIVEITEVNQAPSDTKLIWTYGG